MYETEIEKLNSNKPKNIAENQKKIEAKKFLQQKNDRNETGFFLWIYALCINGTNDDFPASVPRKCNQFQLNGMECHTNVNMVGVLVVHQMKCYWLIFKCIYRHFRCVVWVFWPGCMCGYTMNLCNSSIDMHVPVERANKERMEKKSNKQCIYI